ncbi:MAG TPA: hypothetical protein V6D06_12205 [Trichocoleus sp.]
MTDSSKLISQPKPLSRWVVGPLFVISIVLHGLLLVAPLPSGPTVAPEEAVEEDSSEEQIVDILSIASPSAPAPEAAPPPSQPPPAAAPPPTPRAAAPVNPDRLPPPSEAPPIETVEPGDDFNAPVDPPAQESSGEAAFDFTGARNDFMVNLGNGIGLTNYTSALGLPARSNFRDPATADLFLSNPDSSASPPPGARDAQWLDKEPDSVLAQLVNTYSAAGVNFSELAPYAGERFFVALTPDNQPFLYLSMVRLQGSTLLVIWDTPPAGAAI